MKIRCLSMLIALCLHAILYVLFYFGIIHTVGLYCGADAVDRLSSHLWLIVIAYGLISSLFVGTIHWVFTGKIINRLRRIQFEMELIASGDLDVEIQSYKDSYFVGLEYALRSVRAAMIKHSEQTDTIVQRKTKELSHKIVELEKIRDVMTDSVLLAKNIQRERDQLKVQLQQALEKAQR